MISEAELAQWKAKVEDLALHYPASEQPRILRLIREVEELREALREMLHDWDQGAFLTRVALAKARAALGEKP